jgi:DNA-binding NtrC family response regulator
MACLVRACRFCNKRHQVKMDIQSVKQRFGIIGTSSKMNEELEIALRVAPTDLSVLVAGESGVGKEFFPQVIHAFSPRKHNKYVAVNCGAIPEGTIDSELFGHEKGAFTGAVEARKGYFEEANGGTIFLDEVAELPLSTQVRLLRILQTGEFMRVGSAKTQKVDVRVVAATNISLPEAIAMGKFREDLYYRLNTVPIVVPPLRERREDIYLLFRKFAADIANQYRMPVISLDEGARKMLESYFWPGNVRQLKNVAEQISAVEETRLVTPEILHKYIPAEHSTSSMTASEGMRRAETFSDEREILYRILFDMRSDITEIKNSLAELRKRTDNIEHIEAERGEIAGLLPSRAGESQYVYDEPEVVEETSPAEMTKEQALKETIIKALQKTGGKRKEAARMLFISERTLYRKIKELGIENY